METANAAAIIADFLEEYFQEHQGDIGSEGPQLDLFEPAEEAVLASLWKPQSGVPSRPSDEGQEGFLKKIRPNFLLHGLNDTSAPYSQPTAHHHISRAEKRGPTFLYGTSGAGKTRTVLEYLSRNKGFYFLAHDFERNAGSRDLYHVLVHSELREVANLDDIQANHSNRDRIRKRLSMLLFVRYSVHEKLEALLNRDLTPHEWLLYQLFPEKFLGGDVFCEAMEECLFVKRVEQTLAFQQLAKTAQVWSVFVDEAQALLGMNKSNFLNEDGDEARSAFSAVLGGLGSLSSFAYLRYPVFSGIGLSFDQFSEETLSIVGKSLGEVDDLFFADFKLLGVEEVRQYLRQILDLSTVRDDVLKHVAGWLRGRPRWTASFVEVYCSRREGNNYSTNAWRTQGKFQGNDAKLMEALDRYLNVMTREELNGRRESWSAGRASAYACFERMGHKIANARESQRNFFKKVERDLEYTVCRYAVGQNPHPFTNDTARLLIENGVAAVRGIDRKGTMIRGHIDEPMIILSGINYFCLEEHLRENLERQEPGGQGEAFERLLLPGLLMEKHKLHTFVKSHLDDAVASALEPYGVSGRSAYGVLCVDTRGEIDKTIEWVAKSVDAKFEGQVAPFCYPDNHIGPDVIFLLRNSQDYEDFRACIVQSKHVTEVDNQQDALLTLVPGLLYHERRGKAGKEKISMWLSGDLSHQWNTLKDKVVSDERPCLRLLVQMPAEPTSSAVSGNVAPDATSPTSKSKSRKRDWLIVVRDEEAEELLSTESANVVRLLKRPKEAK